MEITRFFCHSDFTWNQFWSFWSPKNYHCDHLSGSEFWTFGHFWHFQAWNSPKIKIQSLQNCYDSFWPSELSQNWFHIVRVARKLLNFPIRLLRSVVLIKSVWFAYFSNFIIIGAFLSHRSLGNFVPKTCHFISPNLSYIDSIIAKNANKIFNGTGSLHSPSFFSYNCKMHSIQIKIEHWLKLWKSCTKCS